MKQRRAAILGLARSGTALALALRARGVEVRAADAKPEGRIPSAPALRDAGVELFFGGNGLEILAGAEVLVVSPGVPLSAPAVVAGREAGVPVRSEIEIAWQILTGEAQGNNRYLAVTGTNGKSTTAAWIAEILRRAGRPVALAGNIGVPLSEFCDSRETRDFVIEMSSFQLETIEHFRADVAVVTNLTPDHLDRHGSLEDYARAKGRIFENQRDGDRGILNADDPLSGRFHPPARSTSFSRLRKIPAGVFVDGGFLVSEVSGAREEILPVSRISLPGVHNLENALAAAAVARCAGVAAPVIAAALSDFAGLPHRTRLVATLNGVAWINDSKGTNPDAVIKSLAAYRERSVVLILGGSEKGSDFCSLREPVARAARVVLTIGRAAEKLEAALAGPDIFRAGDMARAVQMASEIARPGETVLLSPACASFDQYRDFEQRGEHFESLVLALPAGGANGT